MRAHTGAWIEARTQGIDDVGGLLGGHVLQLHHLELRLEARAGDESTRVGGLESGSYHIRVTDFMGEVWSEGRLSLSCGDVVAAEVVEEKGLRVLNHPEWYQQD